MNLFDVQLLTHVWHLLEQAQVRLIVRKMCGQGSQPPDWKDTQEVSTALFCAETFFSNQNFANCLKVTHTAKLRWQRTGIDVSSAHEIVNRLLGDLSSEIGNVKFLKIHADRADLVDKNQPFGNRVFQAFPSSERDLKEAGNCIAAECGTGAVFHLMRAAEFALRALASDRSMAIKDKPLDQTEWGTILSNFEGILNKMRQDDKSLWKDQKFKESQVRFYNDSVQEFRAFNEAWRRYVSHAHQGAFYDTEDAENIMRHVGAFMEKLSARIGEGLTTPQYWDTE